MTPAPLFQPAKRANSGGGFAPLAGLGTPQTGFRRHAPADLVHSVPAPVEMAPDMAPDTVPPPPLAEATPRLTRADLERARAEGQAMGRDAAQAELGARMAQLDASAAILAQMLKHLGPVQDAELDHLAHALDDRLRGLAAERAGMAIDAHPPAFAARIMALSKQVADTLSGLQVMLHPDDLGALEQARDAGALGALSDLWDARLQPHPALMRGDVRMRGPGLWLDDVMDAQP